MNIATISGRGLGKITEQREIVNTYAVLKPGVTVWFVQNLHDIFEIETPVSGEAVAIARSIHKKRRSTHVKFRHLTTDGVIKRTIAKHRALKDSAADLNRLTGIAGIR